MALVALNIHPYDTEITRINLLRFQQRIESPYVNFPQQPSPFVMQIRKATRVQAQAVIAEVSRRQFQLSDSISVGKSDKKIYAAMIDVVENLVGPEKLEIICVSFDANGSMEVVPQCVQTMRTNVGANI